MSSLLTVASNLGDYFGQYIKDFPGIMREVGRLATQRHRFSEAEYREKKKAISRGIAARLTRGNVAVQRGCFITSEDIERQRAELESKKNQA